MTYENDLDSIKHRYIELYKSLYIKGDYMDGAFIDKDGCLLMYNPFLEMSSFSVPLSINTIGDEAFANNPFIEDITISKNVTRLGNRAFLKCVNLKKVTFKNLDQQLTINGSSVFTGCISLNTVDMHITTTDHLWNYVFDAPEGPLYNDCSLYINGKICNELEIPEGQKSLRLFYGCDSIKKYIIKIGDHVHVESNSQDAEQYLYEHTPLSPEEERRLYEQNSELIRKNDYSLWVANEIRIKEINNYKKYARKDYLGTDESIDEWALKHVCVYDNYPSDRLVKALRGERITEFDMTEEEWKEYVLYYKEPSE